jgi:hypothetical protein
MVSPNLIKRVEDNPPLEINENTKKLFQVIYSEQAKKEEIDDDVPKIKVSTLISKVAFFYEKVRNAVDYDEEHLLRKNAIARILRRQVVIEGALKETDAEKIATHLLTELIRGAYLPNNTIPEIKIKETTSLLEKYIVLKNKLALKINTDIGIHSDLNKAKQLINQKNSLVSWILSLAACEIEENLAPNKIKQMIVNNMFDTLSKNIKLPDDLPYNDDLAIQIYLSIDRNFLKFDEEMLNFVLFKYYNGEWLDINLSGTLSENEISQIEKIATNLIEIKKTINDQLVHPLAKQLTKIVRVYSLYFSILSETVENSPVKMYAELQNGEKAYTNALKKVCNKKYVKAKNRLWRAAVRSIIYIFLTKSVFVLLIEIPAIQWFGEKLNYVSLMINIAFPAILLFFIVFLTRMPKDDNTNKIINGIKEITILGGEKKQPITLRRPAKRKLFKNFIFSVIYAISFCVSVYFIIKLLTFINFNWVSITIFLFFLAFVSFFSILTTRGIKELMIVERKENVATFLIDLFYMPIILVGRWLSNNISKVNVFIFIFDFIIEAPFKVLVEIGEDWTKYVRERRDNMD